MLQYGYGCLLCGIGEELLWQFFLQAFTAQCVGELKAAPRYVRMSSLMGACIYRVIYDWFGELKT